MDWMTIQFSILSFRLVMASLKPFDDSILFDLQWPGTAAVPESLLDRFYNNQLDPSEAVVISSGDQEKYLCSLPEVRDENKNRQLEYFGASPRELLQSLYQQRSCTYRIEMYWTYELCHGRYVLQYHEEKDSARRVTRQEYYLGQYLADAVTQDEEAFDHLKPPKRKIEEQMLPYYPIKYIQGTVCDITGKPRTAVVHYVCVPDGKNQIYSLEEVSSCEYEIVVLTPRLCTHPAFIVQETPELKVSCYPVDGAPPKPTALTIWEREQQWEARQQHRRVVVGAGESAQDVVARRKQPAPTTPAPTASPPSQDTALVSSFLSGDYCLYGGVGWWKHEYCHGRQVIQFHEDPRTGRAELTLGLWNKEEHLKWISEKPHKRPLKVDGQVRQVTHLYTGGSLCDLTAKPRSVEVRLRCRETQGNPNAVTLYLLEPNTCEYILGVESKFFCDVLQTADDNGLLHP